MESAAKTFFAPVERNNYQDVLVDMELIKNEKNICDIFNSLPNILLVLNQNRQIVFANSAYSETTDEDSVKSKLGLRPGELLGCIHSFENPDGCGTSNSCRYCGAVLTLLESQRTGKKVTKEARLISDTENGSQAFDLQVTASPVTIRNKSFTIVTLVDISFAKRKDVLEQIFFHDLLNKAGSLNCFFESLAMKPVDEKTGKLIEVASNLSNEIVEEISAHRSILEAEKGELIVSKTKILSKVVIENVIKQISCHSMAYEKKITVNPDCENIVIFTDYFLIIRVIMNMLKNALEASTSKDIVNISCNRKNDHARFWVHNSRVLEEDVAHQIFQRSFSTKGKNRGLGTYSMKLLGENYLGGKISFESSEENGTTFYFDLPISE